MPGAHLRPPSSGCGRSGHGSQPTAGARSSRVEELAVHHQAVWAEPSMTPPAARMV